MVIHHKPTQTGRGTIAPRAKAAEANDYFEVFTKAPIPCLVVNAKSLEILDSNEAACREFGYARDKIRSMRFSQLLAPSDRARIPLFSDEVATASELLRARSHWNIQTTAGHIAAVVVAPRPIQFRGARCFILHGTDKWAGPGPVAPLAEVAAGPEKNLQQFAFSAFHDLKEPLHMIRGYLGMLEQTSDELPIEAQQYLHYAVQGADRVQALVHNLLEYFRVEIKERAVETVDLNDALAEAAENLRLAIRDSGASITYDALPTLQVDRAQFVRLFQNLLSNAVKFRKPSGTPQIHCGARLEGSRWHFSVEDDGIGIPPDQREAVFQPFHRLRSADQFPGTGLGLSICRRIIELHGGSIWVEATPQGGSAIHFTIPVKE